MAKNMEDQWTNIYMIVAYPELGVGRKKRTRTKKQA